MSNQVADRSPIFVVASKLSSTYYRPTLWVPRRLRRLLAAASMCLRPGALALRVGAINCGFKPIREAAAPYLRRLPCNLVSNRPRAPCLKCREETTVRWREALDPRAQCKTRASKGDGPHDWKRGPAGITFCLRNALCPVPDAGSIIPMRKTSGSV